MLVSVIAMYATVSTVSGRQTSTSGAGRAQLLAQLHSTDSEMRSEAFDKLRSDPAALRDPKVKVALVTLLERENLETFTDEEEDYANYVGWLSETVAEVVNWSDPRQVCILASSADIPDELANHAKVAVPRLLRRLKNAHAFRGEVVAMLVQALAKGRNDLDPATVQTVGQATLRALHDPDEGVRIDTLNALGKFGGEDMIPALKALTKNDPAVKEWAARAIITIQQRTQPAW